MTRITLSTTYNQPSIVRMAAAAREAGLLDAFISSEVPGKWLIKGVGRVPMVGPRWSRAFQRLCTNVPADPAVQTKLFLLSMLRLALWRVGFRGHWVDGVITIPFDRAVARSLRGKPGSLFVGMPYSSEWSIRRASALGMLSIVNNVNSELRAENSALIVEARRLGIKPQSLWPKWMLDKVDKEMVEADYVIVQSPYVREQLLGRGLPGRKLLVLPNGVDIHKFRPRSHYESSDKLKLLYVGLVSLRKGVHYLEDAAALSQPYIKSCTVIGGVVDKGLLDRTPHLSYRGIMTHDDVASAMREADIFVFPSLFEGMVRAVLEAMASGLVVITTREAGYEGVIHNGENGFLVPSRDPAAIAEVVRYLAEHRSEIRRIGMAARRTAEGYTWERLGQTFIQWTKSLQ